MKRENDQTALRCQTATAEEALSRLQPGMSVFIGTGVSEPRALVRSLLASRQPNLQDLELIQLASLGDVIAFGTRSAPKFRLKTFFSGAPVNEAILSGRIDLIPSRFSRIPELIASGQIRVDAAFLQITPPDRDGYASLGPSVDAARQAMERASLVVGEVNPSVPFTYGDTLVPISEFDLLVEGSDELFLFDRWPADPLFDRVAAQVASVIDDGDCLAFSLGPLFEALGPCLTRKRNLGIHSPFLTDPLMNLMRSGAVTNRNKAIFRGKSLASYAIGSRALYDWIDRNPLVEFQAIDKVFNPMEIGKNPQFAAILPARKVDLSGRIALHLGKSNLANGPGEVLDFFNGAEISEGGRTIFALPSRNRDGAPNILLSVDAFPNQFGMRETVDLVATEWGVATLRGRTVRERAQALIDIAHPDDRLSLLQQAKAAHVIYEDQILLAESVRHYPEELSTEHPFEGGMKLKFRAIRPSDEEEMRRLFYRFSEQAVYYRYFSPVKAMPHARMQEYVNVDYRDTISIVGLRGDQIVAEARLSRNRERPGYGDVAFVVDEQCQRIGIATFLARRMVDVARERGYRGLTADVLATNRSMMRVFEKIGRNVYAALSSGVFELTIPFDDDSPARPGSNIHYVK